ncbi:MAG: 4-(cytidine 5'-diphospho)-2-C-methyl-D-erythritol kinase [Deltaproteobacteria bacterium]|nr:4-(cytidine 5'-diphospho)-2-C-methyl-D-erythritol kinase [Deltaproteobacteria bacterium]
MSLAEKFLCPAKVNLFLKVLGKRPDGYHEISTLMQPVSLCDEMLVEIENGSGVEVICSANEIPSGPSNLAYKAAELFLKKTGIGKKVKLSIVKHIPVGAGLGGGSSDAATVLIALNSMTGAGVSEDALMRRGAQLGSDAPFFILKSSALAAGRGTELKRVTLPRYHYVLVNPGFPVSTAWAYNNLDLTKIAQDYNLSHSALALSSPDNEGALKRLLINDLETATIAAHPVLARLKDTLLDNGADGALMSGSGPTVFGVFVDRDSAAAAFETIKRGLGDGMKIFLAEGQGG